MAKNSRQRRVTRARKEAQADFERWQAQAAEDAERTAQAARFSATNVRGSRWNSKREAHAGKVLSARELERRTLKHARSLRTKREQAAVTDGYKRPRATVQRTASTRYARQTEVSSALHHLSREEILARLES